MPLLCKSQKSYTNRNDKFTWAYPEVEGLVFTLPLENHEAGFLRNTTVVPTKSDSDVLLCLQLLSKNNLYSPFELMRIDSSLVY